LYLHRICDNVAVESYVWFLRGGKGWLDVEAREVDSGCRVVQGWIEGFDEVLSSFKQIRIKCLERGGFIPFVATLTSVSSARFAMILLLREYFVQIKEWKGRGEPGLCRSPSMQT